MSDKSKLLIIAIVLALLVACAYIAYQFMADERTPDNLAQQESSSYAAPDFKVKDMQGNDVYLSSFKGKPVVLNFWASWCPPCKQELPDFDNAYNEYKDKIEFMMVNMTDGMQETEKSAKDYLAGQEYSFPVYFDVYLECAYGYAVRGLPTTFFIDAQGNIVTYAVSMLDAATLKKGIDMILQ